MEQDLKATLEKLEAGIVEDLTSFRQVYNACNPKEELYFDRLQEIVINVRENSLGLKLKGRYTGNNPAAMLESIVRYLKPQNVTWVTIE